MAGGRQEAGGSLVGGHRSPGPGAGPGRPPRREPAPSLRWEDARPGGGASVSGAPGDCCSWLLTEAARDTAWPEAAPGGSVCPISAAGQHVPCGKQGLGGTPRRLQGPLGLSGALPSLSCSVSRGDHHRLQPPEVGGGQKEAGGSSVAAAQHLLDGVRGPGPLKAARGHEQPSPKNHGGPASPVSVGRPRPGQVQQLPVPPVRAEHPRGWRRGWERAWEEAAGGAEERPAQTRSSGRGLLGGGPPPSAPAPRLHSQWGAQRWEPLGSFWLSRMEPAG
ncbi:unnamed protein product [Rangifer tarandus platyrhynchus]|uniref:Uncharacterized protein n=2 Tax=Rangifer tarandus platyrhynchus TaxID=3082113 RepID=A0ABN8Y741_RANTA|nr:unnamed protein product [Rangifer tarandus platyrhynchus]CAI9695431.1 unnamed protein product [Rangifer tarandus platyrhynchus]